MPVLIPDVTAGARVGKDGGGLLGDVVRMQVRVRSLLAAFHGSQSASSARVGLSGTVSMMRVVLEVSPETWEKNHRPALNVARL